MECSSWVNRSAQAELSTAGETKVPQVLLWAKWRVRHRNAGRFAARRASAAKLFSRFFRESNRSNGLRKEALGTFQCKTQRKYRRLTLPRATEPWIGRPLFHSSVS